MEVLAAVLVVLGYVAAVPIMFRLRAVFAERRGQWFAAFMGAMVTLVVGYLLGGRPVPAAINAVAAAVLVAAWWLTGRRARARGVG